MKTLLSILFFTYALSVSAQYEVPPKDYSEEVKNRILAVELISEVDENSKNLNSSLKQTFEENWKWSKIEYLTPSEIEQILDEKNADYLVLKQEKTTKKEIRTGYIDSNGKRHKVGMGGTDNRGTFSYTAFSFGYYEFNLILPTSKKPKTLTSIGLANGDLSSIDFLYVVQQLNRLVQASLEETPMEDFYNVERNIAACKELELAILTDFIKEKEKNDIGNYYTYNFELVNFAKYEDLILKKTQGVGYVKIIWSNQHSNYAWIVVNAENGETLSLLTFGGVKFGRSHEANDIIKAKHYKYITGKTGQKINDKYN